MALQRAERTLLSLFRVHLLLEECVTVDFDEEINEKYDRFFAAVDKKLSNGLTVK